MTVDLPFDSALDMVDCIMVCMDSIKRTRHESRITGNVDKLETVNYIYNDGSTQYWFKDECKAWVKTSLYIYILLCVCN